MFSADLHYRLAQQVRVAGATLEELAGRLFLYDLTAEDPLPLGALQAEHLCISLQEGFRGPVLQAWETDAAGGLVHVKLQDPSLFNWFGLALAVRDNEISDFPICNKSFDLSYCGHDL